MRNEGNGAGPPQSGASELKAEMEPNNQVFIQLLSRFEVLTHEEMTSKTQWSQRRSRVPVSELQRKDSHGPVGLSISPEEIRSREM